MSLFNESKIALSNGQTLEAFEVKGSKINREPVEVKSYLRALNVNANKIYQFDLSKLGFDFEPKTLWGSVPEQAPDIANQDSLTINVKDKESGQVIFPVNLKGRLNTIGGKVFYFAFKEVGISSSSLIELNSSVALTQILIYGKKVFIDGFSDPTLVI